MNFEEVSRILEMRKKGYTLYDGTLDVDAAGFDVSSPLSSTNDKPRRLAYLPHKDDEAPYLPQSSWNVFWEGYKKPVLLTAVSVMLTVGLAIIKKARQL
jgi:hypothetical protein